jgi:hypothetical protein
MFAIRTGKSEKNRAAVWIVAASGSTIFDPDQCGNVALRSIPNGGRSSGDLKWLAQMATKSRILSCGSFLRPIIPSRRFCLAKRRCLSFGDADVLAFSNHKVALHCLARLYRHTSSTGN